MKTPNFFFFRLVRTNKQTNKKSCQTMCIQDLHHFLLSSFPQNSQIRYNNERKNHRKSANQICLHILRIASAIPIVEISRYAMQSPIKVIWALGNVFVQQNTINHCWNGKPDNMKYPFPLLTTVVVGWFVVE